MVGLQKGLRAISVENCEDRSPNLRQQREPLGGYPLSVNNRFVKQTQIYAYDSRVHLTDCYLPIHHDFLLT
jgi:hypothetical protein